MRLNFRYESLQIQGSKALAYCLHYIRRWVTDLKKKEVKKMGNKTEKLVESTIFMAGMTALGGFCNAYTYMTRGGVFANAHTANMAKLGIALATLDWHNAFAAFVPILGCLLGSVLCEMVKDRLGDSPFWLGGHWHIKAMLMELLALFIVGWIPITAPDMFVTAFMSFVTGFQLNLFRNWKGGGHNTTICTGNLRTMSQLLYKALVLRDIYTVIRLLHYTGLLFSFALGAVVCTLLSLAVGVKASWGGCIFLILWLVWLIRNERRTEQKGERLWEARGTEASHKTTHKTSH